MFKKIAFVLMILAEPRTYFYKLTIIDGNQSCIQAYTTKNIAKRFKAIEGTCKDVDCLVPSGSKHIMFVGKVMGFYC